MIGLPCGEEMLIRFDTIPERDGQTDGRTDRQNSYINDAHEKVRRQIIIM